MRVRDYTAPSLHPNIKKEPLVARQPTPDEDILRPPEDSDDDILPDSDFDDAPPMKKRKKSESEDSVTMEFIRSQPSAKVSSVLENAPSDIKPTAWGSSQKKVWDSDEDIEERFGLSQKSRMKKSSITYMKGPKTNIHVAHSKVEKPKKTLVSPAKTHQGVRGFITRDTTELEAKCMHHLFLVLPRSMNGNC